jgi:hypothetical protein
MWVTSQLLGNRNFYYLSIFLDAKPTTYLGHVLNVLLTLQSVWLPSCKVDHLPTCYEQWVYADTSHQSSGYWVIEVEERSAEGECQRADNQTKKQRRVHRAASAHPSG